jgi:[ribosomal protein S5]-alanine N-acetyltransferase
MNTLVCDSFTLEPQVAAHADEMFVVLSDAAIYEHENQPPVSPEWLRSRFTRLETRRSADGEEQWLNWVIRLPTSELIGYVQATVGIDGRAWIAYELSSAYWGRGLASRAVRTMIDELARNHGVRVLAAVFKRNNARSRRLLERLGFSIGAPETPIRHGVASDEMLMCREVALDRFAAYNPDSVHEP